MSRTPRAQNPEDLTDTEVRELRRISFSATLEVLERYSAPVPPAITRLEFLERYLAEAGVPPGVPHRFALAQATQFLSEPAVFSEYVPEKALRDIEWLRFMVEVRRASDADLAFQIDRARGGAGGADVETVRKAREKLGLEANGEGEDTDTIAILNRSEKGDLSARDFLLEREWLRIRVEDRDLSDGAIAKELARIGFPCDRSTVRLYRKTHDLRRQGYTKS